MNPPSPWVVFANGMIALVSLILFAAGIIFLINGRVEEAIAAGVLALAGAEGSKP